MVARFRVPDIVVTRHTPASPSSIGVVIDSKRQSQWAAIAAHAGALRTALARRYEQPDADDLAQDTLLRAMRSAAQVPPGSRMLQWLTVIARNVAIDRWRRRHQCVALDLAAHVPAIAADHERMLDVERALSQLGHGDRRLLGKVAVGMRYDEIARSERASEVAIRKRVARARARLLQRLMEGQR